MSSEKATSPRTTREGTKIAKRDRVKMNMLQTTCQELEISDVLGTDPAEGMTLGTVWHTHAHRQTDRQRHTETDRDTQRQTETDRDRQRQTETDRDRQRQTETDRHTHTHPLHGGAFCMLKTLSMESDVF